MVERSVSLVKRGEQYIISCCHSFLGMSEHAGGRADEVGPPRLVSCQADDEGGCVGQGDARLDRRPADQWWALQAEAAEE